jgi:hypothetical protein
MYRQGDVAIIPVDMFPQDVPEGDKQVGRDKGRIILAYGEVTGHAHAINSPKATMWTLPNGGFGENATEDDGTIGNNNDRLLVLDDEVQLTHEEHATISLPAGSFLIRRQREYSPGQNRFIAD